ncbi:MAG: hypothetical protein KDI79_09500 [Anaerolineae bacterium]|nr:hypothetical protein [Anaerolineae bacterium]
MKKLIILISVALLVLLSAAAVYAKSVEVADMKLGAGIDNTGRQVCAVGVILSDGSQYTFTGSYELSAEKNGKGKTIFHCQGALTTDLPETTIHINGGKNDYPAPCSTGMAYTGATKWKLNLSPSGQASYKCQVEASN